MSVTPSQLISARRRALGLSETDVSARSGLSVHEYCDIEQHADEVISVTDLANVRRLLATLGIQIGDLLSAAGISIDQVIRETDTPLLPRNELIRESRRAQGLSSELLADALGYETDVVDALENDPAFLESWPIDLIVKLADTLRIPVRRLVMG